MNLDLPRLAPWCGCLLLAMSGCTIIQTDKLNQAIERGDIETVRMAIARGVDVNGRGMGDFTPLMTAAVVGRLDICELLVKHGADANAQNDVTSALTCAVSVGNEEVVHFLLKSGADRSWASVTGHTAESRAREKGYTKIAALVRVPPGKG